ncbi:TonB-dependent receptor plug domain-containing protein [Azotobacter armeniacus]
MRDRNVGTISDALRYTAGVQSGYFGEDDKQDWFIIRGFKQANNGLYRDVNPVHSGWDRWPTTCSSTSRAPGASSANRAPTMYG